ncbi:MAG: hypothetical protein N3H31_07870 [Candidatus Nezhaarchaeota archaeon]|nr:hypothetical protein [Candidatus Nezhaarchaeota archaeon]
MGLSESRAGRPVLLGRFKYVGKVEGYTFGRVKYEVDALMLSRYSQPLRVGGASVEPGSRIEREALDGLVRSLTSLALNTYKGELEIVDEVRAVE